MKELYARCVSNKWGKCEINDTGEGDVSIVIGMTDNQDSSADK
jgi:hypothetical protein